jgi:hypothetical protein
LLVPVVALALHAGYGRSLLERDRAGGLIRQGRAAAAREDWTAAAELYGRAAALLEAGGGEQGQHADRARLRELRFAQAEATINAGTIVEGGEVLDRLLNEVLSESRPADDERTPALREAIARTAYHTAWLMRLEGAPQSEWKPESLKARQHLRMLSEGGDEVATDKSIHADNLEAVVRFERMTLEELRGLPLPKACQNCKNVGDKKREQRQSKGKGKPKDAREQIKSDSAGGSQDRGPGA